jgi:hypothetical protein
MLGLLKAEVGFSLSAAFSRDRGFNPGNEAKMYERSHETDLGAVLGQTAAAFPRDWARF